MRPSSQARHWVLQSWCHNSAALHTQPNPTPSLCSALSEPEWPQQANSCVTASLQTRPAHFSQFWSDCADFVTQSIGLDFNHIVDKVLLWERLIKNFHVIFFKIIQFSSVRIYELQLNHSYNLLNSYKPFRARIPFKDQTLSRRYQRRVTFGSSN